MKLRNLGRSGLKVSVVGLGCNNLGGRLDRDGSRKVVHAALDQGITLFDTADVYPVGKSGLSEELLGEFLGTRRKDVIVATKFGIPLDRQGGYNASRSYIIRAVEDSLKRLKTDWIDLYQVHKLDPITPIEETLRALDDLIRQGKVRYVGCSNFPAWKVVASAWAASDLGLNGFVACQDEYSLIERGIDAELLPAMQEYGLGLLPFFPLASGLLTGKYRRNAAPPAGTRLATTKQLTDVFFTDEKLALVEKLEAFCRKRDHSLLELAFSWLLARPTVSSVIAGASTPEQLAQNVRAVDWSLSADDMKEIDGITALVKPAH
jgi:aryl-alcohol dehydrogenase-like predicted oxidoreductase